MALICIFCIGFASSATRVSSMTLLQYSVDADMRGRVASFYAMINQTGPAFASLFVGAAGDYVGVQLTMGLIGVWTLAAWAIGVRRKPAMRDSLEKDVLPAPTSESRKTRRTAENDVA
jgi:MFS family permease